MTILYDRYGNPMHKEYEAYLPGVDSSGNLHYYDVGSTNTHYSTNPTLFRVINLSATVGASIPVQLYKGDTQLDIERPISSNSVRQFDLTMPSPNMSLKELLYKGLVWFFYRGEFMVRIYEDIFRLEPLNPQKMTKNTNDQWEYRHKTTKEVVPDENLVYWPYFDPDHDRGKSPAQVLKQEISNDQYAVTYNTEMFKNFGAVGGILKDLEGVLTPKDMEKLVDLFNARHAGAKRAGRTLGLPKGIDYDTVNHNLREMEFGESRDRTRDTTALAYGVHKALLGVTDQVNRSVSEEATRMLILHTIKPQMVLIQEKFNQVFFRRFFPGIKMNFDFDAVEELKESAELRLNQAKTYRELGYTLNEINERFDLGMEDVPDEIGNMRLIPSNLIPATDLSMPLEVNTPPAKNDDTKALAKYISENEVKELVIKDKRNYMRKYNQLSRKTERKFAGKMGKFFSNELGQVLKFLYNQKSMKANIDETAILMGIMEILNDNKSKIVDITTPIYQEASKSASVLASETIGVAPTPAVAESIVSTLTNRLTNTSNHTYRLIRTQVKDGANAGETLDQIADRIKSVYKMSPVRSRIIARTETATVINRTADKRYKEEGVQKKRWLSAGDGDVRESHAKNDSLGTVDYNFMYPNGQQFPNDGGGGKAENINCRCTFIPVL